MPSSSFNGFLAQLTNTTVTFGRAINTKEVKTNFMGSLYQNYYATQKLPIKFVANAL
jgi:hypothetical protein